MKTSKKFLSAVMAFCMLLGTLSVLSGLSVFAASGETARQASSAIDFLGMEFETPEAKLESMDFKLERYGYKLYVEPLTGEVAIQNTQTGDILSTNPYDVGTQDTTNEVKEKLLSQIVVNYNSVDGTITSKDLNSFTDSAKLGQITVKNIKNGVRVEYIIGKQETRYVFPYVITKERFEETLLAQFPYDPDNYNSKTATAEEKQAKFYYDKLTTYYSLKDLNDPTISETIIQSYKKDYPVLADPKSGITAIYVFQADASEKEKNLVESIIKRYCPDYTFDDREADHELCQYVAAEENPVQFRVALEYYVDETGLRVRMPANGIRYDQSSYELNKITCLPYMGAGKSTNTGYTMFPDGSGTLTRFEDVTASGKSFNFFATPYGQDYAYHSLKISKNLMPMRMPVFGIIDDVQSMIINEEGKREIITRSKGFFAIIEEGDSMAMVRALHGSREHVYNSVQVELDPRPKDTYTLNVVSATGNNTFTKVSDRKYTGSFVIRYIMLTDYDYAERFGVDATGMYDTSYMGMAFAYRNRLISTGALTDKIASTETDIPLYIETLGAMQVKDKVLSIPVKVMKALTTFEDVKTMHKELGEQGITNLVFKLTGFINGGLVSTLANKIDAEKVVGGNSGLKDLQKYANENGFEIYLDTDFSYSEKDTLFDGFNRREQAVRTVDDRFVKKQTYSAVLQKFTSTNMMVIAPSSFEDIFDDLKGDAQKLGLKGLSLGALGSDLSSDFDEDEPYNREDSKGQIVDTLKKVREAGYSVMLDGGNAYAVSYADHILGVPLDSSRRSQASEAIPFFGLVYHGYISYTGSPTNMAGDIRYETLKMLENGANPYYILVYRNSEKLKEDEVLSQYFSISYENWKEDLVASYKELNSALGPVIGEAFTNHEFLTGLRVPSAEEKAADEEEAKRLEEEAKAKEEADRLEAERQENLKDHLASKNPVEPELPEEPEDSDGPSMGLPPSFSEEEEEVEEVSKYFVDNGMIVKVTFENGYSFILNYNIFDITVDELSETVIESLGYVVLDADGKVVINSAEEVAA